MSTVHCGCDPEANHTCDNHTKFPNWGKKAEDSPYLKNEMPYVRHFESGATRDIDHDKMDYEGFLSPLVLERYATYMHKNRVQKDGSTRDSDNWQRGIPLPVYMKSLWRHFMDLWIHHRTTPNHGDGYGDAVEEALCGILFNTMGYLHEFIKGSHKS